MATCVIYAVIMRYFFSISHTFLEEFMTTLFAFTTFWGIGICIVENEHVTIDSFYNMFPARLKKIISIINYIIVLIVDLIMVKFGLDYALRYGKQISFGMRVPMIWMYGIIPLGTIIAFVCIAIKLVILIKSPISHFEKNTDRFN
ncbi:TRAP transporter small permease [Natranaerovirga pectinivora]|nr:TRAP transporter small permease subunit [Natranaerovirga pectinivora]